jgi:hypothetical protein
VTDQDGPLEKSQIEPFSLGAPHGRKSCVDQSTQHPPHIMTEPSEKLQQQFQRDINRCSDSDRNMRKRGLQKLLQELPWPSTAVAASSEQGEGLRQLCFNILFPVLVPLVHDPIEKCREHSLGIIRKMVEIYSPVDENRLMILIQELCQRLGELPFPEQGEELRLQIVELLQVILLRHSFSANFLTTLEDCLLPTAAKGFQDSFPAAKRCWSEILITFSPQLSSIAVHKHHKILLKGLLPNCSHQHHKVRSLTMKVSPLHLLSPLDSLYPLLLSGCCFSPLLSYLSFQ